MSDDDTKRGQLITGTTKVLAEEIEQGPQQRTDHQAQSREGKSPAGRLHHQRVQSGATVQPMPTSRLRRALPAAVEGGLAVMDQGLGDDLDLMPSPPDAPAEVEVIAVERQRRIEATQLVPDVPTHQHPRRTHGVNDVAVIVLTLVVLTTFQSRGAPTRAGDAETHFQQQSAVVPAACLGSENSCRWIGLRGEQELLQAVRSRSRVVVQQPNPLCGVDVERLINVAPQHAGAETSRDGGTETGVVAGVDHDHTIVAEGLGQNGGTGIA